MSAAHTPGPWYLNPRGWVVQSTGDIVTRLECSYNKEANARLIAAAPELLEALEGAEELAEGAIKLLRQLDMETGRIAAECVLRDARAAIAKAKGGAV